MTYSDLALNPTGGAETRHTAIPPALGEDLMVRVVDRANMHRAWKRVKRNQGAPSIDGMTLEEFPAYAREHWPEIRQSLLEGTYQPSPLRRKSIPKPGGKGERLLGIPTVVNRVIGQAILQVLSPIFDPDFSASSFGFRPKRSAHGAVKQVRGFIQQRYRIAVDLDLEKFFDNRVVRK
jgi:RNA-directed DNA polymerase